MTRFFVPGTILGKPRPRFSKKGGVFTHKKFKDYERAIARAYRDAGGQLLRGPVEVSILTHRPLPKSRPKRVEKEPDMFKPDVDNVVKIVLDGLNGVAYEDDRQVVRIHAAKSPRKRIDQEYLEVLVSSTS